MGGVGGDKVEGNVVRWILGKGSGVGEGGCWVFVV